MCGIIIAIIVALFAAAVYFVGGMALLGLILVVSFISSAVRYSNSMDLRASVMRCPNCGSQNIRIESRVEGMKSTGSSARTRGISGYSKDIDIKRSHIGVCSSCGYDYPYVTKQDVEKMQDAALGSLITFSVLLGLYVIVITIAIIRANM